MGLNIADIRQERVAVQAEQQRGNVWKPGKGGNRVRLASWTSPVTGKFEWRRLVWIHQNGKGAPIFICGNSPARTGERRQGCVHCEQYEAVRAAEGAKKAAPFKSKKRYNMICVPLEKQDQPFKSRKAFLFPAAQMVGDAVLALLSAGDEVADVNDYFGPNGLDFKIMFDPDAPPVSMYGVKVLPKNPAKELGIALDPALFSQAALNALDPYQNDTLEPGWYLEAQGKTAGPVTDDDVPPPAAPVQSVSTPKPVAAPTPAPAVAQAAPAAVPAATQAPVQPGFLSLDAAKAHVAQPGLEGWKVATDPDGDAYFIGPDGKTTQYEAPPVPVAAPPKKKAPPPPPGESTPPGNFSTPEAQMAARGMKPTGPLPPAPADQHDKTDEPPSE